MLGEEAVEGPGCQVGEAKGSRLGYPFLDQGLARGSLPPSEVPYRGRRSAAGDRSMRQTTTGPAMSLALNTRPPWWTPRGLRPAFEGNPVPLSLSGPDSAELLWVDRQVRALFGSPSGTNLGTGRRGCRLGEGKRYALAVGANFTTKAR